MGDMRIILLIDNVVYVCICRIYSDVFKEYSSHEFICDRHFSQLENSECCGAIIDNKSYAPICVLEEKDRKIQFSLNNMLRVLFEGSCIVEYALKVTTNDFS